MGTMWRSTYRIYSTIEPFEDGTTWQDEELSARLPRSPSIATAPVQRTDHMEGCRRRVTTRQQACFGNCKCLAEIRRAVSEAWAKKRRQRGQEVRLAAANTFAQQIWPSSGGHALKMWSQENSRCWIAGQRSSSKPDMCSMP